MQIKELARATGVDIETIRFYEREGLWPAPARLANGYRNYAPVHLERLSFIRHCRALDISLPDVRRLLGAVDAPQAACAQVDQLVEAQLGRVRARLASMQALEQQLLALRRACCGTHADQHCGILQELVSAAQGEACACHIHGTAASA